MLISEPSAMATENDFEVDFEEFKNENTPLAYENTLLVNHVPNGNFLSYISP